MSEVNNDIVVEQQNVIEGNTKVEPIIEEQKKLLCNEENKGRSKFYQISLFILFLY